MLNKEDTLALAWEHSEGSGKRYTFTEDSLFAFLKEFTREKAPSQDGPVGIIQAIDGLEGEDPDEFKEVNVWVDLPVGTKLYATRPAQKVNNVDTPEQQPYGWHWRAVFSGEVVNSGFEVGPHRPNLKDRVEGVTFEYQDVYAAPSPRPPKGANKI